MGRTLQFDLITDNRFTKTPRKDLAELSHNVFTDLQELPVFASIENIRKLKFRSSTVGPSNNSYRQRFYISKEGRITWQKIQQVINAQGYAPYYQFI